MLPPDTTTPTRWPPTRPFASSTAAMPAAPAPSASILVRSRSTTIARAMAWSLTVITSSTYRLTMARVRSAGRRTEMPSAIVAAARSTMRPARNDSANADALARDLERDGVRLVVSAVGEDGLGAAALDRGELRERHALRQHHGRGRA